MARMTRMRRIGFPSASVKSAPSVAHQAGPGWMRGSGTPLVENPPHGDPVRVVHNYGPNRGADGHVRGSAPSSCRNEGNLCARRSGSSVPLVHRCWPGRDWRTCVATAASGVRPRTSPSAPRFQGRSERAFPKGFKAVQGIGGRNSGRSGWMLGILWAAVRTANDRLRAVLDVDGTSIARPAEAETPNGDRPIQNPKSRSRKTGASPRPAPVNQPSPLTQGKPDRTGSPCRPRRCRRIGSPWW